MADSRLQVSVDPDVAGPPRRVQDTLRSALLREVSADPGGGAPFGDCVDAQFSDIGPFGDVSV